LLLNLPKQTSMTYFTSPYLIQRGWTSSMPYTCHVVTMKINYIISICVSLFHDGKIMK
jgi:hypothetical protein